MKSLLKSNDKEVWLSELKKPYDFETPPFSDFVCILFANDLDISTEARNKVSDQLVRAGCAFAVCGGDKCSIWDDSIDEAYLAFHEGSEPEELQLMTSWHEGESISDILHFAFNGTAYRNNPFNHYLILLLGNKTGLKDEILKCAKEHFSHGE